MDDEWEIPPVALDVEKELGEGAFGEVYKGVVRGPIPGSRTMKDSIGSVVAIKYLKGTPKHLPFINFSNKNIYRKG